jgi:hypothetical protein
MADELSLSSSLWLDGVGTWPASHACTAEGRAIHVNLCIPHPHPAPAGPRGRSPLGSLPLPPKLPSFRDKCEPCLLYPHLSHLLLLLRLFNPVLGRFRSGLRFGGEGGEKLLWLCWARLGWPSTIYIYHLPFTIYHLPSTVYCLPTSLPCLLHSIPDRIGCRDPSLLMCVPSFGYGERPFGPLDSIPRHLHHLLAYPRTAQGC